MSRRVATMALTAVLLVALVALAWLFPVPYVAMSPGPTVNVLRGSEQGTKGAEAGAEEADGGNEGKEGKRGKSEPVIEIDGYSIHRTGAGQLDLTTVSATPPDQKLELFGALKAWLDPKVAVVPASYLYPENQSPEEVEQVNAELMETSQHDAVAAALRAAEEPVEQTVAVAAIQQGAPALGNLKAGDFIQRVDGQQITKIEQVVRLVSRHEPGEKVDFTVLRDGRQVETTVTTDEHPEDPEKAIVGITVGHGYAFDGDVSINLPREIGGPSAGSMFALGIYDKVTPGALTEGRHIAGTGTIDGKGKVGPIGGIQQKVIGARDAGATIFLVPSANCEAAAAAGIADIRLVRVTTLESAIDALEHLQDGKPGKVPYCTGPS